MFRFRLFLPDGTDVAHVETPVPNWVPGDTINTDDGRRWFVLATIPQTEAELPFDGYLEVQPLEQLTGVPSA